MHKEEGEEEEEKESNNKHLNLKQIGNLIKEDDEEEDEETKQIFDYKYTHIIKK